MQVGYFQPGSFMYFKSSTLQVTAEGNILNKENFHFLLFSSETNLSAILP